MAFAIHLGASSETKMAMKRLIGTAMRSPIAEVRRVPYTKGRAPKIWWVGSQWGPITNPGPNRTSEAFEAWNSTMMKAAKRARMPRALSAVREWKRLSIRAAPRRRVGSRPSAIVTTESPTLFSLRARGYLRPPVRNRVDGRLVDRYHARREHDIVERGRVRLSLRGIYHPVQPIHEALRLLEGVGIPGSGVGRVESRVHHDVREGGDGIISRPLRVDQGHVVPALASRGKGSSVVRRRRGVRQGTRRVRQAGRDEGRGWILHRSRGDAGGQCVVQVDVADGVGRLLDRGRDPCAALRARTDRPGRKGRFPVLRCPGGVVVAQEVGEGKAGPASVRPMNNCDRCVGEDDSRIDRRDGAIVPVGDQSKVDSRENRPREVDRLSDPREVVND